MSIEGNSGIWKELREPFNKSGQTRPGFEDYLGRLDRVFGLKWSVKTRAEGSGIWCEIKVWGEGSSDQKSAIGKDFRDALLDREVFYTLLEARVLTERYRRTYNQVRPHSSLGYRPPAPEALLPADPVPVLVGLT